MSEDQNRYMDDLKARDPGETALRGLLRRTGYNRDFSPLTEEQLEQVRQEEATELAAENSKPAPVVVAPNTQESWTKSLGRKVIDLTSMLSPAKPETPETPTTPKALGTETPAKPPAEPQDKTSETVPAEGLPAAQVDTVEPQFGFAKKLEQELLGASPEDAKARAEREDQARRTATGGVIEAVSGLGHAADMVTGWFGSKTNFGKDMNETLREMTGAGAPSGMADSTFQSILGFLIPFGAVSKGLSAIGVSAPFTRGMIAGGIVDATFVDPDAPLITEMIAKLDPDIAQSLTRFIGSPEAGAERTFREDMTRRLGRAGEGMVVGLLTEGLVRVGKYLAASRKFKTGIPAGAEQLELDLPGMPKASAGAGKASSPAEAEALQRVLELPEARAAIEVAEDVPSQIRLPFDVIDNAPAPTRILPIDVPSPGAAIEPPKSSMRADFEAFQAQRTNLRPGPKAPKADKLASAVETFNEFLNARGETGFGNNTLNQVAARLSVAEGITVREAKGAMARVMTERLKLRQITPGTQAMIDDITTAIKDDFGEEGSVKAGIMFALGRAAGGAALGAMIGDSPEEKVGNALVGAGIGAAMSPKLLSKLISKVLPKVDDIVARHEGRSLVSRAAEGLPDVRVLTGAEADKAALLLKDLPDVVVPTGRHLDINFSRIDTSEDVKRILMQVSGLNADEIAAARALGTTQDATHEAAKALGMSVEDFVKFGDGAPALPKIVDAGREMLASSARRLLVLRDLVRAGDQNYMQPFLHQFEVHGEIQRTMAGVSSNVARALNMMKRNVTGEIEFLEKLSKAAPTKVRGGMTAEKLAELMTDMTGAELNEFTRKATSPTAMGALLEVRFGMMLSNPKTWGRNLAGNTAMSAVSIPERFAQSLFTRDVHVMEALDLTYGMVEGFGDALSAAKKMWKTGESTFGYSASKLDGQYAKQLGPELFGLNPNSAVGRASALVGNAVRAPGNILETIDEFFKMFNYRGELRAQARRTATHVPVEGKTTAQVMDELLRDPTPAMQESAERFAKVNTFTNSLFDSANDAAFSTFRDVAGMIQRVQGKHPWLKIILPFVRTPANLAIAAAERTPGLNLLSAGFLQDLAAGGVKGAEAKAKLTTSILFGTAIAGLVANGYITGSGPKDKVLREQLMGKDGYAWQPNSVFIPGVGYADISTIDPVGGMISTIANVVELIGGKYADEEDQGILNVVAASILMLASVASSKTYVSNLAAATDAIRSGNGKTDAAGKFITQTIVGTVSPAILAEATRAFDPVKREVDGLLDQLRARTPGFSTSLPPRVNVWGQEQLYGHGVSEDFVKSIFRVLSPINIQDVKQHPAAAVVEAAGAKIGLPVPTVSGVKLTPQQEYRFYKLIGNDLKINNIGFADAVAKLPEDPRYAKAVPGVQQFMISKLRDMYIKAAETKMKLDDPDLQTAVMQHQRERVIKLGGGLPNIK